MIPLPDEVKVWLRHRSEIQIRILLKERTLTHASAANKRADPYNFKIKNLNLLKSSYIN